MKMTYHTSVARSIGWDSWELLNFMGLSKTASIKRQVAALGKDREWLRNHMESLCGEIDRLICDIDGSDVNATKERTEDDA